MALAMAVAAVARWCPGLGLALLLGLSGCASVSTPRQVSQTLPASESAFGRSVQRQAAPYDGRSGFRLLPNSNEAFRAAPS